jgi:hypothetical protein
MFHTLIVCHTIRNILILRRVPDMQVIKIIVRGIERASMTRLDQKPERQPSIFGIKTLPLSFVDGAVEVEGAVLGGSAAGLGPDCDL